MRYQFVQRQPFARKLRDTRLEVDDQTLIEERGESLDGFQSLSPVGFGKQEHEAVVFGNVGDEVAVADRLLQNESKCERQHLCGPAEKLSFRDVVVL